MTPPELTFDVKPIPNTFPVVKTLMLQSTKVETNVNKDGEFVVDLVFSHSLFSKDEGETNETLQNVLDDDGTLRGIVWNGSNCLILNETKDFDDVSYGYNMTSQKCKSGKRKYIVPKVQTIGLKQHFRFSLVFDIDLLKKSQSGSGSVVNSSFYIVTNKQLLLVPNVTFDVKVLGERGDLNEDFMDIITHEEEEEEEVTTTNEKVWWKDVITKVCGL